MGHAVFESDGSLVAAVDFDYDAVDGKTEVVPEESVDAAATVFQSFMRWVFQNANKNPDGLKIRAIIMCWVFIPELRQLSMTDMATAFGMKKQSLGRWVEQFKKDFPNVRSPHMKVL